MPSPPSVARARPAAPRRARAPSPVPEEPVEVTGERNAGSPTGGYHLEEIEEIKPDDIELHEKIGSGTTAEVFRATYNGQIIAVKKMTKLRRLDVKEQIAFNREVNVLRRIDHPNLVQLIGVSLTVRPFQIMTEFCAGGTVFELIYNQPEVELVWAQQLKMCTDVARAVNYLHGFNPQIIHRDLKSLNLLLAWRIVSSTDAAMVKVTDFGLARLCEDNGQSGSSAMTRKVGTLNWMAPEVFVDTNYSEKIDIYSFAMILFEIASGEPPFEDKRPEEIEGLVRRGERPDMEAIPPDCPEPLQRLMVACWAQNPQKRPTIHHAVQVLEALLQDVGIASAPPSAASRDRFIDSTTGRDRRPPASRDPAVFCSKTAARGPANVVSV